MSSEEIRNFLQEVNDSDEIQQYLQTVSAEMYSILEIMSLHEVFDEENKLQEFDVKPRLCMLTQPRKLCKYHSSMNFLMKMGTTQNSSDAGSVLNSDVEIVFLRGNLRERCSLFMNLLCVDKKCNIMRWLMEKVQCIVATQEAQRHTKTLCADQHLDVFWWAYFRLPKKECCFGELPAIFNLKQLNVFMHALCICTSGTCVSSDVIVKKDIRKTLCKFKNCPRKNTRQPRPHSKQNECALEMRFEVPPLSCREIDLHQNPVKGCSSTKAFAENEDSYLQWLTGRMTWQVQQDSFFAEDAAKHNEAVVAGPSGHTHTLLTYMRIFNNFDLQKWTLICMVWLVGADHHSLFEVLTTASRHGIPYMSHQNSLEFARELLLKVKEKSLHITSE